MPWPISDLPITIGDGVVRRHAHEGIGRQRAPGRTAARRCFAPIRVADAENQAAADDAGGDARGEESTAVETRG